MESEEQIQLFTAGKRKRVAVSEGRGKSNTDSKQQRASQSNQARVAEGENGAAAAEADAKPERAQGEASTSQPSDTNVEHDEDATFKDLGVTDWLCGVLQSLGITQPTPVQRGCIPAVLAGRDVIGTAQTGSGKTAAFALPILQRLAKDPYGVFALVLTPTRELAVQLAEQFRAFGAGMSLRVRMRASRHRAGWGWWLLGCGRRVLWPLRRLRSNLGRRQPTCAHLDTPNPPPYAPPPPPTPPLTPPQECVVIGGVEQQSQAKQLARRPHVVVATPGRLAELIDTDPNLRKGFAHTR